MGRMTHFKAVLKDKFFASLGGLGPYLCPEDILASTISGVSVCGHPCRRSGRF